MTSLVERTLWKLNLPNDAVPAVDDDVESGNRYDWFHDRWTVHWLRWDWRLWQPRPFPFYGPPIINIRWIMHSGVSFSISHSDDNLGARKFYLYRVWLSCGRIHTRGQSDPPRPPTTQVQPTERWPYAEIADRFVSTYVEYLEPNGCKSISGRIWLTGRHFQCYTSSY